MRLVLVQLSDIHLRDSDNGVLGKAEKIASAICSVDAEMDGIALVYCGDLAYSGRSEEYMQALDLVVDVKEQIRKRVNNSAVSICEIIVPGNHDCDFSGHLEARDIIIQGLLDKLPADVSPDIVSACVEPQREFAALVEAMSAGTFSSTRVAVRKEWLVNGQRVVFSCLNSAWISTRREMQGRLFIPLNHLPRRQDVDAVFVTVVHHPYNWLSHNNALNIRELIEADSDLVLTGHEHTSASRDIRGDVGNGTCYIEAAALQNSPSGDFSAFQLINIDVDRSLQRVILFKWSDGLYHPQSDPHEWQPLQRERFRSRHGFVFSGSHRAWLDDLGVVATHPRRASIARSDVFVYPDVQFREQNVKSLAKIIRGEDLAEQISANDEFAIVGPDASGKTTLLKQLIEDLRQLGCAPVVIECERHERWQARTCVQRIERAFCEQYGDSQLDSYRQLSKELRVVLFDNFNRFSAHVDGLNEVTAAVLSHSAHLVYFSNEVDQQLLDLAHRRLLADAGKKIKYVSIMPLGHLRRSELAEKWLGLDIDLRADTEKLARERARSEQAMAVAIGKNFVPPYPVFVLPLLQALSHDEQVNVSASTYGYFYESLIRRALATGGSRERLDLHVGFLTHLARHEAATGSDVFSEDDLTARILEFRELRLVSLVASQTIDALLKSGVLALNGEAYSFKYAYIRYYFTALAIRETLHTEETRRQVTALAGRLHEETAANILLFLVHLTKDVFVVDLLISRAREVYQNLQPSALLLSDSPVGSIENAVRAIAIEDGEMRTHRREMLEAIDARTRESAARKEGELSSTSDAYEEMSAQVRELLVALKTLQILGQLAVNYPGTLDGNIKVNIVSESRDIGLRVVSGMFKMISENAGDWVRQSVEFIQAERPDLSDEVALEKARESAAALPRLVALGILRRIVTAIGSPHLGPVYDMAFSDVRVPSHQLLKVALQLEQAAKFPEEEIIRLHASFDKNPLADSLLLHLVTHHMYVFEMRFHKKQSICERLGIEYRRLAAPRTRALLVRGT